MRLLVTGAGGFIGATLLNMLAAGGALGGRQIDALAAVDREISAAPAGVDRMTGDLGTVDMLRQIGAFRPDVVFHLAAVPGGAAEQDYLSGRQVNLDATLGLFEKLAETAASDATPPVVVYASTVAVYGINLPHRVTPETPLRPVISYGAHKLACEILLADFTRRGLLDGRSVRLPGIVARPRSASGLTSAFMSDLLHALVVGERFVCPVGPTSTAWWMSAHRCAQNLMHAAVMDVSQTHSSRAWPLPVLRLSIADMVDTLADLYGQDRRALVQYEPQSGVEAVFGRYPILEDGASRALGLRDDETSEALVQRALGQALD